MGKESFKERLNNTLAWVDYDKAEIFGVIFLVCIGISAFTIFKCVMDYRLAVHRLYLTYILYSSIK